MNHTKGLKHSYGIIAAVLIIGLLLAGGFVYKAVTTKPDAPQTLEEAVVNLPVVDPSVVVNVVQSKTKDNTIVLSSTGLKNKMNTIGYELTFESNGIVQGVTSGNKPVDVNGKDSFEREVYLGTCSKNVCRPYPGVKKISLVLEFTGTDGKKSQFTRDYDL